MSNIEFLLHFLLPWQHFLSLGNEKTDRRKKRKIYIVLISIAFFAWSRKSNSQSLCYT